MTRYQLKNGATIEDFLIVAHTAGSFETTEPGYDLLVAMTELLFSIKNYEDAEPDRIEPIETFELSFLTLFRLWLGVTGFKVPTLENPTLEDAFTVLFGVGEADRSL